MRIGMIAASLSRRNGGVSEAVRLASEALIAQGLHEVCLFAAYDDDIAEDAKAFPVPVTTVRAYGTPRYGFAPGLVRVLLDADLDILHVHGIWTFHALAAWIWMKRTGRPVIIAPHGMLEPWILQRSPRTKALVWRLYLGDLFRKCASVQALTHKEAQDVEAQIPGARTNVIAHYVPMHRGEQPQVRPDWWQAGDEGRRVFIFLGRLHVKKGVMELCDAWEDLCLASPALAARARMIFCGWNDGIEGFEDRVADLDRRFGNIHFTGPQYGAQKWRTLESGSFMVLPSHSEGLPMSIVEAWSAGLPTIMTEACNLPDGCAAGGSLEVTHKGDSIRETIERAIAMSDEDLEVMRGAARGLVERQYSCEAIAGQLSQTYAQALSEDM